jgi:hypothetical protein
LLAARQRKPRVRADRRWLQSDIRFHAGAAKVLGGNAAKLYRIDI